MLDREARAWELRLAGFNHHQIAEQIGVGRRAIGKILERVYDRESAKLSDRVASYLESNADDPGAILGHRGRPARGETDADEASRVAERAEQYRQRLAREQDPTEGGKTDA